MAYIADTSSTNGIQITRTPSIGNDKISVLVIGPGVAVPTSGLIWWNKK